MASTRPSIMSDGATMSAPAEASEAAALAIRATLESFSTSKWPPSSFWAMRPQWPCEVYSQRQTSAMVTRASSLRLLLKAREALLDDAVVGPGSGALLVLFGGQAEEEQASEAEGGTGLGLFDSFVDREVEDAGHGRNRFADALAGGPGRADRSGLRGGGASRGRGSGWLRCGGDGEGVWRGSSWG